MNTVSLDGPSVRACLLAALIVAAASIFISTPARAQTVYISNYGNFVGGYNVSNGAPLNGFLFPAGRSGLALSGNNLYVSDQNNNTVLEYDASSGAENFNFASPTDLSAPYGMAISGNSLYVANDSGVGFDIGVYNATSGAVITHFTLANQPNAFGLAISGNILYVGDTGNNTVGAYDATTGLPISSFGDPTTHVIPVTAAAGVTVANGILYVASYESGGAVSAYDATTGAPEFPFDDNYPTGLSYPESVAVAGNTVYTVTNVARDGGDLLAFDATDGDPISQPQPLGGLNGPQFIVATPEPGTIVLALLGSSGFLFLRRRKTRAS